MSFSIRPVRSHGSLSHTFATLLLAACAVYLALYFGAFVVYSRTETAPGFHLLTSGMFWVSSAFALAVLVCGLLVLTRTTAPHFLFRHRVLIGFGIVAVACVFGISGSSLGMWSGHLGGDFPGLLFGMPRAIRSDEWLVITPFFSAQANTGFPIVSDTIRATDTITSIVYAQPSWSIATLFHPFLIGFLFLGFARGLAFFWAGRLVAMFLVTFECTRLWTRDNRWLSGAVAFCVTFAPQVQWWFAVNGTAELFIFGEGLVVLLYRYLRAGTPRGRWVIGTLMAWSAGCYLLIFYPAWQIAFFYVFALMGVWVVLEWRDEEPEQAAAFRLKTCVPMTVAVLCAVALLGIVFYQGRDAVVATLGTVYPGERLETGGSGLRDLIHGGYYYLLPFYEYPATSNPCEASIMFPCAFACVTIALYVLIRTNDRFLGIMTALLFVYVVYIAVGFPATLSKVTLLSMVPAKRLALAAGFLVIVVLVRSVTLIASAPEAFRAPVGRRRVTLYAAAGGLVSLLAARYACNTGETASSLTLAFSLVPLLLFVYLLVLLIWQAAGDGAPKPALVLCMAVMAAAPGFFVNPVQMGVAPLTDNEEYHGVAQIVAEEPDAVWATDGNIPGQLCVSTGAKTISCVNVYPDLERWHLLDPTGEYEDVYNRYAHISILLQPDEPTSFTLNYTEDGLAVEDAFNVNLNIDDLKVLGIDYLLTGQDLAGLGNGSVQLQLVKTMPSGRSIYRVVYLT